MTIWLQKRKGEKIKTTKIHLSPPPHPLRAEKGAKVGLWHKIKVPKCLPDSQSLNYSCKF